MKEHLISVLEVIKLGEKLKYELRHSWLSNGRQESVAEHTWRVSLMAVLIEPYLEQKVDMAKLLKMIIIHDLVEAEATDVPAFDTMNNAKIKKQKELNELKAIENIKNTLQGDLGLEVYNLWIEFENKQTFEAKVANALDKLEAQIQHNEADIDTWLDIEYKMSFLLDKLTNFNQTLNLLKDIIEEEAESKLVAAGVEIEKLKENPIVHT